MSQNLQNTLIATRKPASNGARIFRNATTEASRETYRVPTLSQCVYQRCVAQKGFCELGFRMTVFQDLEQVDIATVAPGNRWTSSFENGPF